MDAAFHRFELLWSIAARRLPGLFLLNMLSSDRRRIPDSSSGLLSGGSSVPNDGSLVDSESVAGNMKAAQAVPARAGQGPSPDRAQISQVQYQELWRNPMLDLSLCSARIFSYLDGLEA